jgi:hypothetical protein
MAPPLAFITSALLLLLALSIALIYLFICWLLCAVIRRGRLPRLRQTALASGLNLRSSFALAPSADPAVLLSLADLHLESELPLDDVCHVARTHYGTAAACACQEPADEQLRALMALTLVESTADSRDVAALAFLHLFFCLTAPASWDAAAPRYGGPGELGLAAMGQAGSF